MPPSALCGAMCAGTGSDSQGNHNVVTRTCCRLNPLNPEESLLPSLMRTVQPQLRPIVMLRNPVERLYSA